MNANDCDFTPEEQRTLDLLVDGELGEAERRRLLAAFDERPGAWRRCALAFLEAQSIAGSIRELLTAESAAGAVEASRAQAAATAPAAASAAPVTVPAARAWWSIPHGGMALAAAASFLVAFGLAWYVRQVTLPAPSGADDASAARALTALSGANRSAMGFPAPLTNAAGASAVTRRPPEGITLLVNDRTAGGSQEIQLPVVEAADSRELRRNLEQPSVSAPLRDALERLGHHVEEHRQLVPVNLRDGRQAIVPVDDIEIMPVSTRGYQ